VHLQLDGLARAILSRRMRAVYSHLTSGVRVRRNCALALLGAVAARSRTLAWETLRAVDFSLPAFATLANPPRTRKAKAPSNATHTKQSSPAWCGADPLKLPARDVFVRFALAFFAHRGDPALIRSALGVKALFGNVLRKLAADPPALAREALAVLRDVVMSPSGGVPARLRAALMSDAALEQLAAISGTRAGGGDERRANEEEEAATTDREEGRRKRKRRGSGDAPPFGGERGGDDDDAPRESAAAEPSADDARADAANLAHDALTRLCLDPAHGLCPASALGRWTLERRGGSAVRSARVEGGGSGGRKLAALTRLLRALRPTESRRHADLLLAACSARPRVAAAYIPRATHSLDPRASVPWLAAATLLGRIAGFAAEDPAPLPRPPPAASIGDAEGAAFVAAALPPSLTRHALAKGVAHDVGVVAHASLCLLLRVARAIRVRVTRLDHAARDAREAGDEDAANAYAALAERARRAALADVLPDPRALADAHARAAGDGGKNGDGDGDGKGGGAGAGGAATTRADAFVRAHAINALAEYAELAGGDALAEAKVDPARFLPDASASLARIPAPELAAAIRLLAARGGDREVLADLDDPEPEEEEEEDEERHRPRAAGAREEEDDEDDSEDDSDDSEALAPHSAAHSALAAAAGEAAFRVASRRAAEAASHRVGSHIVPGYPGPAANASSSSSSLSSRGHVLAVLRVAAGASCARVRRAAASLAAAHFASSGALEDPEAARREAGAWVAALPAAPEEAAEAARGFLAEAAGEAARRGPAALDAAAAALRSRRERARGARVAATRRDASRGGAGADDYLFGDAAAAARNLDLEEGSHGSSSLDLEFSGLAACAIPACVKVLRSAKKTRLQRLAVASYVAAATHAAIIQQRDPAPLAALALEAFARGDGGERGKETPVDLRAYPALESLVAFAATVVEGGALALAPESHRESSPERRPPPSPDTEDHPSSSPSSSAVALLGADRVSLPGILRRLGPRAAAGACGALAVAAHGPAFPRRRVARGASAASAVAFAATRAAGEGRGRGGAGAGGRGGANHPGESAEVAAATRDAIARASPAELPALARAAAFWCARAGAALERSRSRSRGGGGDGGGGVGGVRGGASMTAEDAAEDAMFAVVVDALGATLAAARRARGSHPEASRAARRAIFGSPTLAPGRDGGGGFVRWGARHAAAFADALAADLEAAGEADAADLEEPGARAFVAAAAAAARRCSRDADSDFDFDFDFDSSAGGDGTSGKGVRLDASAEASLAAALATAPLVRYASAAVRRDVVAGWLGSVGVGADANANAGDPAVRRRVPLAGLRRALAAEVSAAALSRLSSPPPGAGKEWASRRGASEASAALAAAFRVAAALASTGTDDAARRASEAATAALRAAREPRAAAAVAAGAVPDFAALAGLATDLLPRAVASPDPPRVAFAAEIVASSESAAARLLALVADAARSGALLPRTRTREGDGEAARREAARREAARRSAAARLLPAVRAALEARCRKRLGPSAGPLSGDRPPGDAEVVAAAFGEWLAGLFLADPGPLNRRGEDSDRIQRGFLEYSSRIPRVFLDASARRALATHAAATLAAATAIAPLADATRLALLRATTPPEGWWPKRLPEDVAPSRPLGETDAVSGWPPRGSGPLRDPLALASASRLLFGGADADAATARRRAACLLSTLRVLALAPPRDPGARSLWRRASADLDALLDARGATDLRAAEDASVVAAARGFARAALRRRFRDPAALAAVRRVACALEASASRRDRRGRATAAPPLRRSARRSVVAFAEDAFERAASHSAFAPALLDPAARAPVPAGVGGAAGGSLSSILGAWGDERGGGRGDGDGDGDGGEDGDEGWGGVAGGGDEYEDEDEDDDPDAVADANAGGEEEEEEEKEGAGRRRGVPVGAARRARSIKLELVATLHALWNLHVATSAPGDDSDDDDGGSDGPLASDPSAWRADQAGLLPLLSAAHGATLAPADRHLAALMLRVDAAAGGGTLAGLGYLWGEAAASFVRTRAALRRGGGGGGGGELLGDSSSEPAAADPSAVGAALRGGEPPDARRCAATAARFPHARAVPAAPPSTSGSLVEQRDASEIDASTDGAGASFAWGYDPAWVLPFALRHLSSGAVEPREFAGWGLASMAFAATAAEPAGTRLVAYACLAALSDALEDANAPSFRERGQLVALLRAFRNATPPGLGVGEDGGGGGVDPAGSSRVSAPPAPFRFLTAAAVFAAEAALAALRPECETYPSLMKAVTRRAALDTDGLPLGFLAALNGGDPGDAGFGAESKSSADPAASSTGGSGGRAGVRALRAHVLRLLLASLRGQADDARLFRKSFVSEVLMSHRASAMGGDATARRLALATVARCAATPAAARPLVESGGLVPWLAGVARSACAPTMTHARESLASRAHAARTALGALADLAEARGAVHGGPTGTAAEFLHAVGEARAALAPIMDVDEEEKDPAAIAVCRAALAPAIRLHVAVARTLRRRAGEVADVAETATWCRAVERAARENPGAAARLRAAALELVCHSAGPSGRAGMFPLGGASRRALALEGAAATAACARWGIGAAAANRRPGEAAARVLAWCAGRVREGGDALADALVAPRGGGGAAALASVLGALRDAAGRGGARAAEAAAVAAQAALLRATLRAAAAAAASSEKKGSSGSRGPAVAPGDEAAVAAAATPAYGALLAAGGALDELVAAAEAAEAEAEAEAEKEANEKETSPEEEGEEGHAGSRRDVAKRRARRVAAEGFVGGVALRGRGATAAALAATLLRGVFAGAPPDAFLQHVEDATRAEGSGGAFEFQRRRREVHAREDGRDRGEGARVEKREGGAAPAPARKRLRVVL
jgi:nucleolar pre-ribosomal-associated protein 1